MKQIDIYPEKTKILSLQILIYEVLYCSVKEEKHHEKEVLQDGTSHSALPPI